MFCATKSRIGAKGCATRQGDDYLVSSGTPVRAPFAGTVTYAGRAGNFGNLVVIQDSVGSYFLAHLSTVQVAPGWSLAAGSVVGHSGNSGRSSGPHLHYEQHGPGNPFIGTPTANAALRNRANVERRCR